MKKLILFSFIPLAVACNKAKENLAAATPSSLPVLGVGNALTNETPPGWRRIYGRLELEEKCALPNSVGSCVRVVGGDDMNDTQVFYLPSGEKSLFDVITMEDQSKEIRLHTEDDPKATQVSQKKHLNLLVKMAAPEESSVIEQVKSVGVIEK